MNQWSIREAMIAAVEARLAPMKSANAGTVGEVSVVPLDFTGESVEEILGGHRPTSRGAVLLSSLVSLAPSQTQPAGRVQALDYTLTMPMAVVFASANVERKRMTATLYPATERALELVDQLEIGADEYPPGWALDFLTVSSVSPVSTSTFVADLVTLTLRARKSPRHYLP